MLLHEINILRNIFKYKNRQKIPVNCVIPLFILLLLHAPLVLSGELRMKYSEGWGERQGGLHMYNITLVFWLIQNIGLLSDLANQDLPNYSKRPIKIHLFHNLLFFK